MIKADFCFSLRIFGLALPPTTSEVATFWQSPPSACVGWSSRIPGSISAGCYLVQRAFHTVRRSVYAAGKYRLRVPCRRAEPPAGNTCTTANRKSSARTRSPRRRPAAGSCCHHSWTQPPDQPVAACPLGGHQALDLIQPSSPLSPSHS